MRVYISAFAASIAASPALAHPGHLGELGGHDHWLVVVAAGIAAVLLALYTVLSAWQPKNRFKGRGSRIER